jgi:hypothetical protein
VKKATRDSHNIGETLIARAYGDHVGQAWHIEPITEFTTVHVYALVS